MSYQIFQGYEWPMFCWNVDSFPFRQISGARYVQFFAKVMPKNFVDFGMTCARKVGHIECPEFAETEIKRCFGMKLVFLIIFSFFRMPMIKIHCDTIHHRGRGQ